MNDKLSNLIREYNRPETILVISSYPEKGVTYSGRVCAVGGFAKNTINSLITQFKNRGEKRKFIILTVTTRNKYEYYKDRGVLVVRCIKRNNLWSYLYLLYWLIKFNNIPVLLAEFEFASFGGALMTLGFLGVLGAMRVLGKRTILVLHQVLFDLNELSGHIGVRKNSFKIKIINSGLNLFYRLSGLAAEKIVVLEEEFKIRLSRVVNPEKITVIPHGVDDRIKRMGKTASRKILGLKRNGKIILYFGYLTWYKGVDKLIETFGRIPGAQLVIAGGPSFTQLGKLHYRRFLQKVYLAAEKNNVTVTGFLNEEKIRRYFSSADCVILPYRTFMSSSGPLSLTLSFTKPFFLSSNLLKILKTNDFRQSLTQARIKINDLVIPAKSQALVKKMSNRKEMQRLSKLSAIMKSKRSFSNLSFSYADLINHVSRETVVKKPFLAGGIFTPANDPA